MFKTLRDAWKIPELRKKLMFTVVILLIYRLCNAIPVPFVNADIIAETMSGVMQNTILGLYDMMSGSALSQASVLALGIQPYINASIIIQLLCIAIPALERMSKDEGEDGKKKIYMAGPLFNEGDRYTNQINSDALRAAGYTTFLPQEIIITNESSELVKAACFYMDFKAIRLCDLLLANCNGIDIDSGTAAEIGLAYGMQKKMIAYKSDVRNYYNEEHRLNNFVGGLLDNRVYSTLGEVLAAIEAAI